MKLRHNAQESVGAPGYRPCERGLVFPLVEGKAAMVDVVPVCDLNATVANFHSR
jgi:hypothetical protein